VLWPFRKRRPDAQQRFLERFAGRVLIVHEGLPGDWLEELFKIPGGAGYFRVDARRHPEGRPTPVEWLVHEYVLPLELPLPVLLSVSGEVVRVRHLTDRGQPRHPSDIAWMLDEIDTRHHAVLKPQGEGFSVERVLAVEDNAVETPYGFSL